MLKKPGRHLPFHQLSLLYKYYYIKVNIYYIIIYYQLINMIIVYLGHRTNRNYRSQVRSTFYQVCTCILLFISYGTTNYAYIENKQNEIKNAGHIHHNHSHISYEKVNFNNGIHEKCQAIYYDLVSGVNAQGCVQKYENNSHRNIFFLPVDVTL